MIARKRSGWSARWDNASSTRAGSSAIVVAEPPAPIPAAMPDLQENREKKDDDRGVGLYWQTASPGSAAALARGGCAAGLDGSPFGLGRLAASIARRLGVQTFLGRLLISSAGGWLLLGGVVSSGIAFGVLAALLALPRVLRTRMSVAAPAAASGASSDDVSSGIVLREPGDRSLAFVSRANHGEIAFADKNPMAPAADPGPKDEKLVDAPAPISVPGAGAMPSWPALNPSGNAAPAMGRLTSRLSPLGDQQVPGSPSGFHPPAAVLVRKAFGARGRSVLPPADKNRGRLRSMPNSGLRINALAAARMRGSSRLAAGQLKLANYESRSGQVAAGIEGGKQFATDAFEQQSMTLGNDHMPVPSGIGASGIGEMPGGDGPHVVVPPGAGAPDANAMPSVPNVGAPVDTTPYQPNLDLAAALAAAAAALFKMGMMLLLLGAALMAAGMALVSSPPPMNIIGYALIAAGVGMMAMGFMMLQAAGNLAQQATQIGQQISQMQDQQTQGQIAANNAQAKAKGQAYTPPDMSGKLKDNQQLHQQVKQEQNATYTVGGRTYGGSGAPQGR